MKCVQVQGGFHERCMLPLIDMCNHNSNDTTCSLRVRLLPSGAVRYLIEYLQWNSLQKCSLSCVKEAHAQQLLLHSIRNVQRHQHGQQQQH